MAKMIITAEQMMRLLDQYSPSLPIIIKTKGLSKIEREELLKKIQEKSQLKK